MRIVHPHAKQLLDRLLGWLLNCWLLLGCSTLGEAQNPKLTACVDSLIGTGGHGYVFLEANVLFGAVQVGSQNIFKGWDWCSGYHYSDSLITGFSHAHLSGTGASDLGDVLIMPYTGPIKTDKGPQQGYLSRFSHARETARPGYYAVTLDDYSIRAELTSTARVGFHRYTFPANSRNAHVIINLKEGIDDKATDTYIKQINLQTFVGYRSSKGWVKDQRVYFAIKTSVPVPQFAVYNETQQLAGKSSGKGAAVKGVLSFTKMPDLDGSQVLAAMKASSTRDDQGVGYLKSLGFLPADTESESVAKTLEYAIDDWSIAQTAKKLGEMDDYKTYSACADYYREYFDPHARFMRSLTTNGKFQLPFDPIQSIHRQNNYTEGNAWQYTWLVPHDVPGLIKLFGSEAAFTQKLDSLFLVQGNLGESASPDISGLIGLYAHGNEPSHATVYLYPYAGQQWKTAEKVRHVLRETCLDEPDGISGNEDCGQMSAWYILSAMGFYPVSPSSGAYVLGVRLSIKQLFRWARGKHLSLTSKAMGRKTLIFSRPLLMVKLIRIVTCYIKTL